MIASQEIIEEYPPLYDEIAEAFELLPCDPIIFSWGARIYNPTETVIPPHLLAHELVHGNRQTTNEARIVGWWQRYMDRASFRLNEEILAHRAEYQWLMANGNRNARRSAMPVTAARLADPLYGPMIQVHEAKALLRTN